MTALRRIVETTREDLERRRGAEGAGVLAARARARAQAGGFRDFAGALGRPGLAVIAEHKRRSPSAGAIREDLTLPEVVSGYERAGAAALSVLTEAPNFGGAPEDLRTAREASTLPILRKDFIVDPYQLDEAVVLGADAVLLIVAALAEEELHALHGAATGLGLDVLVEVHDAAELEVALALGARLIGINNRDLRTLEVDTRRTFELRAAIPEDRVVVAESGFRSAADLAGLHAAGVDAVLIGEALMRAPDPGAALRELIAAADGG